MTANTSPEAPGDHGGPVVHPVTGERLYGREEAVRLARRALCEASDSGHYIVLVHSARQANGSRPFAVYSCANCDVRVSLDYPEI